MKKYWPSAILFLALVVHAALADPIHMKPYQVGDWSGLVKTANGAPMAIHFWGVTCPACVKEMPQWGAFLKRNPSAKVIFIQVDSLWFQMQMRHHFQKSVDQHFRRSLSVEVVLIGVLVDLCTQS